MKKSFIAAFAGVLALAACQKEASVPTTATKTVSFRSAAVQTKTVFGDKNDDDEIPTLWSANDSVSVSYNLKDGKMSKPVIVMDNGLSSIFEVSIAPDAEAASHDFYIVSPAKALIGVSPTTKALTINIPSSQTPLEGSCDEAAQVLYAESVDNAEFPEETMDVFYNHITAYGKISIANAPAGVTSISLTASEDITGRFRYSVENYEFTANAASKSLTINTTETEDVMFAVAPADLSGGSLKVVLATEDGTTYTKNIDLTGKELAFNAAQISKFGVDFRGIQADATVEYTLVKDVNSLHAGDHIIIAAKGADKAISTTQNGNNRGVADITKTGEKIFNPGDAVQIITLEDGSVANTAAFNVGNGYLYAASSSSNYLRTQNDINDNASWKITVAADGNATIEAQGSYTRNKIRFNSTLFSCYASGQGDVVIYSDGAGTEELWSDEADGGSTEPEQPEETYSFKIATSVTSGNQYIIVAPNAGAFTLLAGKAYGYPTATPVAATAVADVVTMTSLASAFTATAVEGGYTFKAQDGNYIYLTGTYNSFNWAAAPTDGDVWSVSVNADTKEATIVNVAKSKTIQYYADKTSFGAYATVQYALPVIYELVK